MATAARTTSRSRALTLLAWLLCALLGPGPALPALHFALVAHRVCVEHGVLEHVDADAGLASRESPELYSTDASRAPRVASGSADMDSHGHDACGVAGVASSVAFLPAARVAVAAQHFHAPPAPSGAERAHQGIALLSYAPKLAPPASC